MCEQHVLVLTPNTSSPSNNEDRLDAKIALFLRPGQWHPTCDQHSAGSATVPVYVGFVFDFADYSLFDRELV
jgi:hypothetical protein